MDEDTLLKRLRTALKYGGDTHSPADVAKLVLAGEAQAWQRDNSLIVTYIEESPRYRILVFWLAAGDMDPLIELSEDICDWGREQGCKVARMVGRKGWKPVLEAYDWEPKLVTYKKELQAP